MRGETISHASLCRPRPSGTETLAKRAIGRSFPLLTILRSLATDANTGVKLSQKLENSVARLGHTKTIPFAGLTGNNRAERLREKLAQLLLSPGSLIKLRYIVTALGISLA